MILLVNWANICGIAYNTLFLETFILHPILTLRSLSQNFTFLRISLNAMHHTHSITLQGLAVRMVKALKEIGQS